MKQAFIYFNYGAIGDALMMTALVAEIHEQKPDVKYYVIVAKNLPLIKDLLKKYEWLDVIDMKDTPRMLALFGKSFSTNMTCLIQPTFGKTPFHVALFAKAFSLRNFEHSPIGFREPAGSSQSLYAHALPFDLYDLFIHNLRKMLPILGLKGIENPPAFSFDINPAILSKYGLAEKSYIVVHLCAANSIRSLPSERWIEIFKALFQKNPSMTYVFTASSHDVPFVKGVMEKSGIKGVCVENESLHAIASLIHFSKGYLGVDTGITHMASVMGVHSIVVGNNSNPAWLPSYNPNAVILKDDKNCTCTSDKKGNCFEEYNGKNYYRCMLGVPNDEIVRGVLGLSANEPVR